jgi:cysteine-rich repeat protein
LHFLLRAFPALCLGILLVSGCGADNGVPPKAGNPEPEAGVTPLGADAGSDWGPGPGSSPDGVMAVLDVPKQKCGNGETDPDEACDDGNTLSGDGCSSRCQIENDWPPCPGDVCVAKHVCGDAFLTTDEVCDDGNTRDGDGCSADCRVIEPGWSCRGPGRPCTPICGDRLLKGGETCDDGNTVDGDGCSIYCLTEPGWDCTSGVCIQVASLDGGIDSGAAAPRCGDGHLSGAEECDDGAANDDDRYGGCTTRCFFGPYCGDGIRNGPEACDLGPGNGVVGGKDGCTFGCMKPHYCGDGYLDTDRGEQCDLGDLNGVKLDREYQPTDDPAGMVYCTPDCWIPAGFLF